MKTNRFLIVLALAAILLASCGAQPALAPEIPAGAPAVDPNGLQDCGSQPACTTPVAAEDPGEALTPGAARHEREQAALQQLVDQQVEKQGLLGMVMAERLADGAVIWGASGATSPSGQERWSVQTPSPIASITKTFTAVVVLQLVEEGKLSLDEPIDTWFPDQPKGDRITVRMLLSHTSGISNYGFGTDAEKWTRAWTPEEYLAEISQAPLIGEPGNSNAHYSSSNYFLLGVIIEKITGNSWEGEVQARILEPLGMKDTSFIDAETWDRGTVLGYTKIQDSFKNIFELPWYPNLSNAWAAGGIVSTASDLMAFASALFDGELLSSAMLAEMTQPVGTEGDRAWALGGGVMDVAGGKAFAMGGDFVGYHAFFIGMLDSKLIVTALMNSEGNALSPSLVALEYLNDQVSSGE